MKKSFLLRSEILGLVVNTLTASYKYSRNKTENVPLSVEMELSGKLKAFCVVFIAFFQSALNPKYFEKTMSLMAQVFLKLLTTKDVFS